MSRERKIFPRNLSAQADLEILGNPASTRPEASVANTTPGLEIDERTVEKYFFPGLTFEYQRAPTGRARDATDLPYLRAADGSAGLAEADLDGLDVFLYAVAVDGTRHDFRFHTWQIARRAIHAWNALRNMQRGRPTKILLVAGDAGQQAEAAAIAAFETAAFDARRIERDGGRLRWAVLGGVARQVMDPVTGLIGFEGEGADQRSVVPIGDMQSTMCTPWHYDFRDCRCYYWAANRPDMVAIPKPKARADTEMNFIRKRGPGIEVPEALSDRFNPEGTHEADRVDIINAWERLPIVIDDREVDEMQEAIRRRFARLATIEHALSVEYLFTSYTVDPARAPQAKDLLRKIAIDEMRHLRWVNEILTILDTGALEAGRAEAGGAPELHRATDYMPSFERDFRLSPFGFDALDWFVAIERPSQMLNMPAQIDGMYVRLLAAVEENPDAFPQPQRLIRLIKLIIDEGGDHYEQFLDLQHRLFRDNRDTESFAIPAAQVVPPALAYARDVGDFAYQRLLLGLYRVFAQGDRHDGDRLGRMVARMHHMDQLNDALAPSGVFPRFTLPEAFLGGPETPVDLAGLETTLAARFADIRARREDHRFGDAQFFVALAVDTILSDGE